ncbi:hypothetical protein E1301_Tti022529 [Triplophysa tibetana]|uniref:Uncharacterized protein n=1 Tax=Triplophysa tibetana TaxID=1572043 RepID=A0A5A9NBK6_9TELE|nr:hypothetical protein E1301_Tti022529 [Triplophysa tibetana]
MERQSSSQRMRAQLQKGEEKRHNTQDLKMAVLILKLSRLQKRRPESRPLPISATLPSLPPPPLSDIAVDMGQESLYNIGQKNIVQQNLYRHKLECEEGVRLLQCSAQSTSPPPQYLSPVSDINMGFPYSRASGGGEPGAHLLFKPTFRVGHETRPIPCTPAQLHGLLLLENLKQQVAQLATIVNLLMAKVNNGLQPAAFEWSEEFQLPMESDAELDRFEAWLADPANDRQKHALVSIFPQYVLIVLKTLVSSYTKSN